MVLGLISAGQPDNAKMKDAVNDLLSDLRGKAKEARLKVNDNASDHGNRDALDDIINGNGGTNINIK